MKIAIRDIVDDVNEIAYSEPAEVLNPMLRRGTARDYTFQGRLQVRVAYYRAERDLFFDGTVDGEATASCGRCLGPYVLPIHKDFSVVLSPETPLSREIELGEDDLSQSFYAGTEVDLTPIVHEQIMLALPTRPLCAEECRGLCSQCGANRNTEECSCTEDTGDPRLAILRSVKIDRGA
jgi:uncharacterized protein